MILLDHLFSNPLTTPRLVGSLLGCSPTTASKLLSRFEEWGLLSEVTGRRRNRRYRYEPYLALFTAT